MYFAGRRCVCACECVGVQNLLMSLLLFGRVFIFVSFALHEQLLLLLLLFLKIIFLVVLLSLMLLVSPLSAAL